MFAGYFWNMNRILHYITLVKSTTKGEIFFYPVKADSHFWLMFWFECECVPMAYLWIRNFYSGWRWLLLREDFFGEALQIGVNEVPTQLFKGCFLKCKLAPNSSIKLREIGDENETKYDAEEPSTTHK